MAEVRLAELVAALSLGVDLGFGQPMEHVLRECLIALRLADRLGLDDAERSTVYYTALLVNVGCHADAHEQAKWFGDDINLRSGKYDHDLRSFRAAAAAMSLIGSGNPPLHRFRVGLEFAISGHRDLDGMIETHASLARGLAERLGLPRAAQEAVGSSYEQWDGKGDEPAGDEDRLAAVPVGPGPRGVVGGGLRQPEGDDEGQRRAVGVQAEHLAGEQRQHRPLLAEHAADEGVDGHEQQELRQVGTQAERRHARVFPSTRRRGGSRRHVRRG